MARENIKEVVVAYYNFGRLDASIILSWVRSYYNCENFCFLDIRRTFKEN
jgi:argininosuccinate synthase